MAGRSETEVRQDDVRVRGWRVERRLLTGRVLGRGPMADVRECGGQCCRHGVYISLRERDRILEYAERVQGAMDGTQTPDVAGWFEDEIHEDEDFEGGVCIGTATYNDKCVFLDAEGLCVLQKLEPELELAAGERLKPFYCRLFPVTTWYGRLEFDDLCNGVRRCCTMGAGGSTRAVDAYAYELEEALGAGGLAELCRAAEEIEAEEADASRDVD